MDRQHEHQHQQKAEHEVDAYRGHDPIQAERSQSGNFNRAWLKDGERLTLLQRSGFATLSLLFVAFGLYLLRFCVLMASDEPWIFDLIFGGATLSCLFVGIMGLRNVLRFPPGS